MVMDRPMFWLGLIVRVNYSPHHQTKIDYNINTNIPCYVFIQSWKNPNRSSKLELIGEYV